MLNDSWFFRSRNKEWRENAKAQALDVYLIDWLIYITLSVYATN